MKMALVRKKHPECREDLQLPGITRPVRTGIEICIQSGIVYKRRVKVRPQEVAVYPAHPSTRLEMRLPEARQRAWHLAGSYWEFWSQVPKGQCGTSEGFGLRLVWLTLQRTP